MAKLSFLLSNKDYLASKAAEALSKILQRLEGGWEFFLSLEYSRLS